VLPCGFDDKAKEIMFARKVDPRLSDTNYLARFVGEYDLSGHVLKVSLAGGGLRLDIPGERQYQLVPNLDGGFTLKEQGAFSLKFATDEKNEATAPGGQNLLTNPFTAYAVNPAKVTGVTINVKGAKAFLAYLTSPEFQSQLASFPNTASPAFFADASPKITLKSAKWPARVKAGTVLTARGTISNLLPGSPVVAGQRQLLRDGYPTHPMRAAFAAFSIERPPGISVPPWPRSTPPRSRQN